MNKLWALILLVSVFGCSKEKSLFKEVAPSDSGIFFANNLNESDSLNILDYLYFYNGGGVAVGDVNGDSLPDIFLTSNQASNKLYLNQGNFKFKDITESAGVAGKSSWNTGTVMLDVNADGALDILVGAVVGINGFTGHNELFINDGSGTFTEQSAAYGLDLQAFTTGFAYLDYDLDGDLDIYVLNHAVHTQESFGRSTLREKRNAQTGDRLMRNDGNVFTDVSEQAGIYGGINGYGLGVSVADFNNDGYADLYIGNDFHEDDYFYLNNGDGTFTESLTSYFGHTSRFSMGNEVADINNDGWPDLISLDMLPWDEKVTKASEGDDNFQTLAMRTGQYGYHYQFSRNMLYVNDGGTGFKEVALQSGIAATDWSWSAIFADFDLDGHQDLHIANGIPRRPNDLDFVRYISNQEIQKTMSDTKLIDQEALSKMPNGAVANKIYSGQESFLFTDKTGEWIQTKNSVSTASAVADLDLDGDFDLVTNNLNAPASILENQSVNKNYLKVSLEYTKANPYGIGAKVMLLYGDQEQYQSMYPVKGFQSSSEPILIFGLDDITKIGRVAVIWPDQTYQVISDVDANSKLTISLDETRNPCKERPAGTQLFALLEENLGIDFTHKEDNYLDFNRQKLIPYRVSDAGPAFAQGDLNGDGLADLFFGSSKFNSSQIYLQSDTGFIKTEWPAIETDSIREDVSAAIFDIDGDGKNDLFIGAGGADFFGEKPPLLDRYSVFKEDGTLNQDIEGSFDNTSVVAPFDYDGDGDIDVFVGANVVSNDFGKTPTSYLLENNNNGRFTKKIPPAFKELGMVSDAIWDDFDGDGQTDLIVVGQWMEPSFFKVNNASFTKAKTIQDDLSGLWQQIHPFDMQGDGDIDYLLANWGLNSKFKATSEAPLYMYYADFDNNGSTETVLAQKDGSDYYPLLSLDELAGQMVYLRKKYNNYTSFAGQTMEQIFGKEVLEKAIRLEVSELRSGYLQNNQGKFTFVPFDDQLQIAPLKAFVTFDFDNDNELEVLVGGNYFGMIPFHGRYDSFGGALLEKDETYSTTSSLGLDFKQRSVRHLQIINLQNKPYLLAVFNNEKVATYSLLKNDETN